MFDYRRFALGKIAQAAPRFLPFADVASDTVPLSRLLRLSLFQVTVGMALVLLVGTLNRVMIVELQVPATLVAMMLALPLVFAPFRALIGYKSDTFRSALGLRRARREPTGSCRAVHRSAPAPGQRAWRISRHPHRTAARRDYGERELAWPGC